MDPGDSALTASLGAPARFDRFRLEDWDRLIPVARRAGLLARVALEAKRFDAWDRVPDAARPHLVSALTFAEKHVRDTRRDIAYLRDVVVPVTGRLVLLKGAAYVAARLPPAAGRFFNDVDILVPRERIDAVENVLRLAGWNYGELDPYDELYYRRWSHQLPPLAHAVRGTMVDVHHSLVPATARIRIDAGAVLAAAMPLADMPDVAVLAPPDMVLHSAVHLLNEGDYEHGLRDLHDLDLLLRQFGAEEAFWPALVARARALDLARPLHYALRHLVRVFGTPVPRAAAAAADAMGPSQPARSAMDALFARALRSPHPASGDALTPLALWLLFVRAHYLRMPLPLLLPHLGRKAVRRLTERKPAPRL